MARTISIGNQDFEKMILRWFSPAKTDTNEFIKALINGDIESVNYPSPKGNGLVTAQS